MAAVSVDDRDDLVLDLAFRFKQLKASHFHELLFIDARSMNPCYNTLNRLKELKLLHRIDDSLRGGTQGGSQQYIWGLGPAGWQRFSNEPYKPVRTKRPHTLEIANVYLDMVRLQRAGYVTIDRYATEPDCWLDLDGHHLRPDLYIEVTLPSGQVLKTFIEVDRHTEWDTKIKQKLRDYVYAVDHVDPAEFPEWPRCLWVAIDGARATQLRRIIGQLPEDDRQLFKVCVRSDIAGMFA